MLTVGAHVSRKTTRQTVHEKASRDKYPIKFAVRSLGWVPIAEEDLTPERSSKAVNKCIVDLSQGRHDINDSVGRWGDVSRFKLHTIICVVSPDKGRVVT